MGLFPTRLLEQPCAIVGPDKAFSRAVGMSGGREGLLMQSTAYSSQRSLPGANAERAMKPKRVQEIRKIERTAGREGIQSGEGGIA